ncbi:MAG TPA: hypothetical protein VNO50_04220 [Pyrinomonadaceae bacterium]|nr:hypothetical protein [Pyrinomonadaceae bacterium]
MKDHKPTSLIVILVLLVASGVATAQTAAPATVTEPSPTLIEATQQYKTSSGELLTIQEGEVNKAESQHAELRGLVEEGLVARVELEASDQKLVELRAQLEATRKQIADSDQKILAIQTEQQTAKAIASTPKSQVKLVSKQYAAFSPTATILRFGGSASWSLGGLGSVESFFRNAFGRSLPTSAIGQSATHNRLGYDHRQAADVALHPDSIEGKRLINYLQSQGIPFLAFRAAVPGVATGPHIHIGRPSSKI